MKATNIHLFRKSDRASSDCIRANLTVCRHSGHHPSITSNISASSDVLQCKFLGCDALFKGKHGRGNYGRHWRQKHRGENAEEHDCEDKVCGKRFQRKDARLKHYRKHHPQFVSRQ
jgi:hypothetical protein